MSSRLSEADVRETIVRYFSHRHEDLSGVMNHEYFLVTPGSTDNGRPPSEAANGNPIDVLAWTMEEEKFAGSYVSAGPSNATNPNVVEIEPIKDQSIKGKFEVEKRDDGLYLKAHDVGRREYLDGIRSKEGFENVADILGVGGDLERITENLYEG